MFERKLGCHVSWTRGQSVRLASQSSEHLWLPTVEGLRAAAPSISDWPSEPSYLNHHIFVYRIGPPRANISNLDHYPILGKN
ncbi:unnamed protein product [Lupinus luteus]|uniref:Uncharacterized protein n=1 Tax=Lupinus luteus TaxID=3873 RepID=A0AAV1WDT9_LUPLU